MKTLVIILGIIFLLAGVALAWYMFATSKNEVETIDERGYRSSVWKTDKNKIKKGKFGIILFIISLLILILLPASIHQVNAGEVAVVKVWGDAKEVRTEGLHFDFWISHKYEVYDTKVQQVEITTQAYSKDAQTMDIQLVVQYQIQADKAMEIVKKYGGLSMLENRIEKISIERTKSVLSQQDAMTIIETRRVVSQNVTDTISSAITDDYYITIQNVVLTDISFSDAFENTVEQKMIAEQDKLKAQYEKEKAVIEAEAKLETAKREAEAILYKAEQEAQAEEVKAQAEANALKLVQNAWNEMSEDVRNSILKKLSIEQWNGELPETMVGTDFIEWLLGQI